MRPGLPLIDAHAVGAGTTGNETWAASVLAALEGAGGGVDYAVTAAGTSVLSAGATAVPPDRLVRVSGSSTRRLLVDLPRAVRRRRPSALLAHYTLPAVRVPSVLVVHDLSFEDPRASEWIPRPSLLRYRATVRTSARRAGIVLTPSEHARLDVLDRYGLAPDRVVAAPNGLDDAFRAAVAATPAASPDRPTVLCVGTVLPRKNLPVLAHAVALLHDRGVDAVLRLVGPVRDAGRADLAAVRRAVPAGALEEWGAVSPTRLVAAYRSSSVLAFASRYEGFGLPLVEAMAAGLPVVTSAATCLPEVLGGAGLLADPDDVEAWADALERAIRTPEPLVAAGLRRSADFDWAATAATVRRTLADVAG